MTLARASSSWALVPTLAATLGGCELNPRAPLDLDAYAKPGETCVTVIHDGLELGGPIRRFVADHGDAGDAGGGWALVEREDLEPPGLTLIRVPARDDEPETPPVSLGLPGNFASEIELRAGAEPGELWGLATLSVTAARLIHLAPGLGLLANNDVLGHFPVAGVSPPCPKRYNRILLLAEGRPYVLAAPDCSPDANLVLHLLEIEAESLAFGLSWELEFDPCIGVEDPTACALASTFTIPVVHPPRTSQILESDRIPIGLSVVRSLNDTIETHDVSLLDIDIEPSGPDARLLTYPRVWQGEVPLVLSPPSVGRDLYSTQLFIRNSALADAAALLRFDTALYHYTLVRDDELPFAGAGELIQLRSQTAIARVEAGRLEAASLVDGDSWPSWLEMRPPSWPEATLYELDDLVAVEQAGVGKLLLRRDEAPPQLVSVDCL